jgi:hypothetical protein
MFFRPLSRANQLEPEQHQEQVLIQAILCPPASSHPEIIEVQENQLLTNHTCLFETFGLGINDTTNRSIIARLALHSSDCPHRHQR